MMSFSKMIAVGFLLFAMMAVQTAPIAAGQTPAITVPENGTPEEIVRFLFLFYDPQYQERLYNLGYHQSIDVVEFLASKSLRDLFQKWHDPTREDHCGNCMDGDLMIGEQNDDENFRLIEMVRIKNLKNTIIIDAHIVNLDNSNDNIHRFFSFVKEEQKWRIDNIYGRVLCQNFICLPNNKENLKEGLVEAMK